MVLDQIPLMPQSKRPISAFYKDLPERLTKAGMSDDTADALLDFDANMFLWFRFVMKGEMQGQLLAQLNAEIELSQFYALTAIARIESGLVRDPKPATVGLLAEEMSLDPSRASRIASCLIADGYIRREVAQDDGRKSILVLTPKAQELLRQFRDLKWENLIKVFDGWQQDEIITFSKLFSRHLTEMRALYQQD